MKGESGFCETFRDIKDGGIFLKDHDFKNFPKKIMITGIDTDAGKTYATGYMARVLIGQGREVITAKPVQSGMQSDTADVVVHRKLMGVSFFPEDDKNVTNPYRFQKPCSPHLAARKEGVFIDFAILKKKAYLLEKHYSHVIYEGAGGLMVPFTDNRLLIDYISEEKLPVILVTSGRLGSINHTLLSLEALQKRNIVLYALLYNHYPSADAEIFDDTRSCFLKKIRDDFPGSYFFDLPVITELPSW